jgi:ferredoxin
MPADRVPGDPATLVMVGNAGPDMWAAFDGVRDAYADGANPLDAWITDVLDAVAADIGATALFPFGGPPHLPFQRWAQRAEPVDPSPLGVLIHPEFGLWHAYRGALAFPEKLELAQADTHPSPCDSCADRPCLSACPVGAFASATYDVPACVGHIMGPDSGDCMGQGCQARRACPIGRAYVYTPDQAGFHMRAFTGAQDGN